MLTLLANRLCFERQKARIDSVFALKLRHGTRTRISLPIDYEYECRFTEYEYDFDTIALGDQREVSLFFRVIIRAKRSCSSRMAEDLAEAFTATLNLSLFAESDCLELDFCLKNTLN